MLTRPVTLVANMMFMSSSAIPGARATPLTRPLWDVVSHRASDGLVVKVTGNSRIVHQHVNLLKLARKLAYEAVDFAGLADVELDWQYLHAAAYFFGDVFCELFEIVEATSREDQFQIVWTCSGEF